jgi:hypothetical protein
LDFRVGSRGLCYILENQGLIDKGEFDRTQNLVTDCRKTGLLPVDFTAEDEARQADHLEALDPDDPDSFAASLVKTLDQWDQYLPVSFWVNQPVYVQMVVEKIDLKSLFSPVCLKYHVPLINARGWSDLNLRAGLMRRFAEHEAQGRRPVLLYCGDHDPVGLNISKVLPDHLAELEQAVGWSPQNLIMDRFGLNADFINQNNLLWIDSLKTSSGQNFADPDHRHHNADFVREYIAKFGERKVEANALVVRPTEGRRLCEEAILKYLDLDAVAKYERILAEYRELARRAMPAAVQDYLNKLNQQIGK